MIVTTKKISQLSLALFNVTLLSSCGKDTPEPGVPGMRLFTNKMEITNGAVKAAFLKRTSANFQEDVPTSTTEKITFIKPDTATFGASTLKFHVVKNGSQSIFYSPRTVLVTEDDLWLYNLLAYNAPQLPIASTSGAPAYITQEVRISRGDSKQLQLSYLKYYRVRTIVYNGAAYSSVISGGLFNEFNENSISLISPLDTIAVRTGSTTVGIQ